MILTPLDQYDARLRQVCAEISRAQLRLREQQLEIDGLIDYVFGLANKQKKKVEQDHSRPNTVGLSANQLGIMKQICVVDLSIGRHGYTDVHVLVNPKIVWRSKGVVEKPEGCVNFPTTWGVARRSRAVRVRAWDRSGNGIELDLNGWPAVLLQHEIDHLNGFLFIDRLTDAKKADKVKPAEYNAYRKTKPGEWSRHIDVTKQTHPVKPDFP